MSNDKTFTLRLPESLKHRLEEIAWNKRIPASKLIRQIAEDYLIREEKQEGKKDSPRAQQ